MSITLARRILSATDDDRLDLIFEHAEELVWNEHGDEVAQFNRLVALYPGMSPASIEDNGGDDDVRMTYKKETVPVPVENDGEDNLRAVLILAGLTRQDLAFRMCVDTDGNSEFAFLMLPPEQWTALEEEFGADTVRCCFLPVGASVDDLYDMLAEPEAPLSPRELAATTFADKVEALANESVSCSVSYDIDDDRYVVLTIETATDEERDRLVRDAAFVDFLAQCDPALREDSLLLAHVVIESEETIERDWSGIRFASLYHVMSAHLWFNREARPSEDEKVQALALLEMLREED